MPLAKHVANERRFSAAELKVQAIARRRAIGQLMRVPWSKFRKAYEEYPRWHALTLWTHAIVASQDRIPSWLIADLRKRCPGFTLPEVLRPEPLDLRLSEWVRNQKCGYAKRQGWLDALTFYGVRHPRSECAWNYWEQCDRDWNKRKPEAFPTFDVWWRDAQKMKLCDKLSYRDLGRAVEKYLDWEALALWLRPLLASDVKLPRRVISELKRRCPGILGAQGCGTRRPDVENSKIWRSLVKWGRNHCRLQAGKQGHLYLRQRAQSHPLHARLLSYAKHWARQQSRTSARSCPSFREWLHNARMRSSPKRMPKATLTSQTITLDALLGQPGLSRAACDALLKLQPTTILQALRIRGVGRKTTSRLFALGLLTDPEGLRNRELTLADLRDK